jgi:hypothetical protein
MTRAQRTTLVVALAAILGLGTGLVAKYLSGLQEGRLLAGIEGLILAVVLLVADAIILIVGAVTLWRAQRHDGDTSRGVTLIAVGIVALAAGLVGWVLGPMRPYN